MGSSTTSAAKHRSSSGDKSARRVSSSSSSLSSLFTWRWCLWMMLMVVVAVGAGAAGGYLYLEHRSLLVSLGRRIGVGVGVGVDEEFGNNDTIINDTQHDESNTDTNTNTTMTYPKYRPRTVPDVNMNRDVDRDGYIGVGPAGSGVVTHEELERTVRRMVEEHAHTRGYATEAEVEDMISKVVPKVVSENIKEQFSEEYFEEKQRIIQENINAQIEQRMAALEEAQESDRSSVSHLREEVEGIHEEQQRLVEQQQQQQQQTTDNREYLTPEAAESMLKELRGAVSELQEGLEEVSEQMVHMKSEYKQFISNNNNDNNNDNNDNNDNNNNVATPEALYELTERVSKLERSLSRHADDMDAAAVQATRGELERRLGEFRNVLIQMEGVSYNHNNNNEKGSTEVYIEDVERMMKRMLEIHEADQIGRTDWALASVGTRVTSASPNYQWRSPWLSPLQWLKNTMIAHPPETILRPDVTLGQCWAFPGTAGYVEITTPEPIVPTAFTLDHVPRSIAVNTGSAPRRVQVYGYTTTQDNNNNNNNNNGKVLLASHEYLLEDDAVQTFFVDDSKSMSVTQDGGVSVFRLEVLNNHGEKHYTCLYRFRIHGYRPSHQ